MCAHTHARSGHKTNSGWLGVRKKSSHTHTRLAVTHLIPGSQHIWITVGWWGREGQAPPDWLAAFKKASLFFFFFFFLSAHLSNLSPLRSASLSATLRDPTSPPLPQPGYYMGGIPASTSQYEVHSFTCNTGEQVKCHWSCFTPSSVHRKPLVTFRFRFPARTEGHSDIYVRHHMTPFFWGFFSARM